MLYSKPNKNICRTSEEDDLQTFHLQPFSESKNYHFGFTQNLGKIQDLELKPVSQAYLFLY